MKSIKQIKTLQRTYCSAFKIWISIYDHNKYLVLIEKYQAGRYSRVAFPNYHTTTLLTTDLGFYTSTVALRTIAFLILYTVC
jgi:hypothetical protein